MGMNRKAFLNLTTHICLVNPGRFQEPCYLDFFSPEKHPCSDICIALLEEVEPWSSVETWENMVLHILSQ